MLFYVALRAQGQSLKPGVAILFFSFLPYNLKDRYNYVYIKIVCYSYPLLSGFSGMDVHILIVFLIFFSHLVEVDGPTFN